MESSESLSASAKSSSSGRRFNVAVAVVAVLALPYARPLVCDIAGYESSHAATSMADYTSIHAQPAGCGSCDTAMDCCVIPVGPTADQAAYVTLFEHPAPEPLTPALEPSSNSPTPLTPPPKV